MKKLALTLAAAGLVAADTKLHVGSPQEPPQEPPKPPQDDVAVGQIWRHVKRDKLYAVVFMCKFTPYKAAREGATLATPDGKYRAKLQAAGLVTHGMPLVVYAPVDNLRGRCWVRPQDEFTDGRFTLQTITQE